MWEFGQSVKLPPLWIGGSIPHAPIKLQPGHMGRQRPASLGDWSRVVQVHGARPGARRSTADRDPDAIEVLVRLQPCPPESLRIADLGSPQGGQRGDPSSIRNPKSAIVNSLGFLASAAVQRFHQPPVPVRVRGKPPVLEAKAAGVPHRLESGCPSRGRRFDSCRFLKERCGER